MGVGLKLVRIECRERAWVALYLAMGWLLLTVLPSLVALSEIAGVAERVAPGLRPHRQAMGLLADLD